ncbi:MAG: 3'(2'),5'-bisphosphate nucleotidase CysQ [Bacteroidota bacterium]
MKEEMVKAVNAAIEAGKEILTVYKTDDFEIETKGDQSPLTRADRNAHHLIMRKLESTGYPVLSEEGKEMDYDKRKVWPRYWCVDPLDGTKEFIKRNGEFTVNIALIEDRIAAHGVIYVPVTQELYVGIRGLGAWKMTAVDPDYRASSLEDLFKQGQKLPYQPAINKPFVAVGSRSHMNDQTREIIASFEKKYGETKVISRGSSLKLCMVAEGKADIYPRFAPTMEWDTAAGQAIAQAAGMLVTTADMVTPLLYNKQELLNPWFVVRKKGVN